MKNGQYMVQLPTERLEIKFSSNDSIYGDEPFEEINSSGAVSFSPLVGAARHYTPPLGAKVVSSTHGFNMEAP